MSNDTTLRDALADASGIDDGSIPPEKLKNKIAETSLNFPYSDSGGLYLRRENNRVFATGWGTTGSGWPQNSVGTTLAEFIPAGFGATGNVIFPIIFAAGPNYTGSGVMRISAHQTQNWEFRTNISGVNDITFSTSWNTDEDFPETD